MNKQDLIRLSIFSLLLLVVLIFYYNLGFLSFTNVNINEQLPKPEKTIKNTIQSTQNIGSVETAKKLNLGFELVGIRGNNPESTIIILEKNLIPNSHLDSEILMAKTINQDRNYILLNYNNKLNKNQLKFILKEGKKRQIRRMCEMVGLKVIGLKRVRIGKIMLEDLPIGKWRYLSNNEFF